MKEKLGIIILAVICVFSTALAQEPEARKWAASTTANDGSALMFGGMNGSAEIMNDLWRLGGTPEDPFWQELEPANTPEARFGHSLVTLPDGRVVMFGGQGENDTLFNDHTFFMDNWSPFTPENDPPAPRKFQSAWVQGEKMYIYGGQGDQGLLSDLWSYDFSSDTWSQHASTDSPGSGIAAGTTQYEAYLYATLDGQRTSYSYSHDQWFVLSDQDPGPEARQFSAWCDMIGLSYFFGGKGNAKTALADAWVYNKDDMVWTQLTDLPVGLQGAVLLNLLIAEDTSENKQAPEHMVYVFGGVLPDNSMNDTIWVYNPLTDNYEEPDIPTVDDDDDTTDDDDSSDDDDDDVSDADDDDTGGSSSGDDDDDSSSGCCG